VKIKILSPRRESNPRTPIVQPVAQRFMLYFSVKIRASLYLTFLSYTEPGESSRYTHTT